MSNFVLHGVEKVTLKRHKGDGRLDKTTLVIEHRANGYNSNGDYEPITTTSEVTLLHSGLLKLPFKIESAL